MGRPFDSETGRKAQERSAAAKRLKSAKGADERARAIFLEKAEVMAKELVSAALGEGPYSTTINCGVCGEPIIVPALDPKDRAGFAKTILEFGIGRAGTRKVTEGDGDPPEDTSGLELG